MKIGERNLQYAFLQLSPCHVPLKSSSFEAKIERKKKKKRAKVMKGGEKIKSHKTALCRTQLATLLFATISLSISARMLLKHSMTQSHLSIFFFLFFFFFFPFFLIAELPNLINVICNCQSPSQYSSI